MTFTRRHILKGMAAGLSGLGVISAMPTASAGGKLTLKISSLAPEGTPWYDMLREIDKAFRKLSNNTVELRIYPGGVLGNETQIIKKMRIGQIHGAMLTSFGLSDVDETALAFQMPGLIQTYEELDFILERMMPMLDKNLIDAGFQPLGWGDVGWARFFSKSPVTTPDDLRKLKIYAWEGDPKAVDVYKHIGLKPVVIASTDMLPSLQTGLVEAIPTTSLAALSYQWFGLAKHMVDIKWSPMVGALVIEKRAWRKVSPELQPILLAEARRINKEFILKIREMDTKAVDVMKDNGLVVHTPTDTKQWMDFAGETHAKIRGSVISEELFDDIMGHHQAFLAQKAALPQ